MKQFIKDSLFTVFLFGPFSVGLALTYIVFAFIAWDSNPGNWSWEFRLVATIFAVCFGYAVNLRVHFRKLAV